MYAGSPFCQRSDAELLRRRLIELRDDGTIGDAAFQRIEQELDLRELQLSEAREA